MSEVIIRQLTDEERAALDAKLGPPLMPRPLNEKELKRIARERAKTAEAVEPEPQERDLLTVAKAVAKATRLKDCDAVITAKSGREARVIYNDRTLACVRLAAKGGIWIWVPVNGAQTRQTVGSVTDAAKLVKTSERRTPKGAS
jgi:hypothetical protein